MSGRSTQSWSAYNTNLYRQMDSPPLGTVVMKKLEDAAREHLLKVATEGAFLFVFGSAGTRTTYAMNRRAFDKWAIVPRMLRNCTVRNLDTTIFGMKLQSPVFLAPIGAQGILHPEAELGTAKAAKNLHIPMIMSTVSSRSIEEVAEVNGDGYRWYQLYWTYSADITLSLLKRAKSNGFSALVVTLDGMSSPWRPHDIDTAYSPYKHGFGSQVGTSDPVFMKRLGLEPERIHPEFPYLPDKINELVRSGDKKAIHYKMIGEEWMKESSSGVYMSWEDYQFIRDNWDGPLVLKGIQHVEDAEAALENGADGIIVSNHGGRQVDGGVPALWSLEKIMQSPKIREAQASGKFTVLFDSSVRTGSDIIKALALGAQAVLIGRPFAYGLTLGGSEGIEHVIKSILADTEVTLGLSGYKSLPEIQGKGEEILARIDY